MIESNPEILGGMPVIKGTRIPITRLLYLVSQGCGIHKMLLDYPQLTERTLRRVLEIIAKEYENENKIK